MKRFTYLFLLLLFVYPSYLSAKIFNLASPDGRIDIEVEIGEKIHYKVLFEGTVVLEKSPISMTLSGEKTLGNSPRILNSEIEQVRNIINSPLYKRVITPDNYNELSFTFKGDYGIIFRAYDDGIAYRFVSTTKKAFTVENEEAVFNFPQDSKAFVTYVRKSGYHDDNMGNSGSFEEQFFKSFVNIYKHFSLAQWDKERLAFMPLLVETADGVKICLTEADLIDYPGMYLNVGDNSNTVRGVFAPYPKTVRKGGKLDYHEVVTERENYIARFNEGGNFPWRTLVITKNEVELLDNDMVYRLASETVQEDISWIKPGKSAWEWWNDWNLYGVDFKAGINNETYKHYIDFAAKNNLEYVIMDEGWYEKGKILEPVPELDLEELVDYARQREVGIILWTGCYPFKHNMEEVCRHYSEMGIKGFKVDFIDRDDQEMVRFHYETAAMAAKYHLIINFHGTYKPTGLQRTYPNVLTVEAVQGLEHMKWASSAVNQVEYDVIMPYIRMLAGPLDYTQGAMRNANRENYKPVYSEPMSQGTRARQVAKYIVFESPLSMLCDSPSTYGKEQESVDFMASIPTVWDDSRALGGEIAEYLVIARRKGTDWYVGAINNWDERVVKLDLSFLGEGNFQAEIFRDGVNADKVAQDYKREVIALPGNREIVLTMAPGGGFVIKITSGFPEGYRPEEIGLKLSSRFIESPHASKNMINYSEVCVWYGALKFAELTGDENIKEQLQARFDLLFHEEKHLLPILGFFNYVRGHYVDFTVFGALPLEFYIQTKEQKYLDLGLFYADYQWTLPDSASSEQIKYHEQGLSWQTRYWIDDMYMITILQSKTFQATGNHKYIERAGIQMVSYLDTLQRANGLFYHAPDAPFYWARGNGWMAVGMTELLRHLPQDNPDRERVLDGYRQMMKSLKEHQKEDGTWGQLIDKPDIWTETSGSAMFTYAMITGIRRGWLDEQEYGEASRKAWMALIPYINEEGDLTEVCIGTGKSNDEQFYRDRPRETGDFHGQAPVLWCAVALLE